MAAINEVHRKDGKSYRVFVWSGGKRLTKTFRKLSEAREWAKQIEGNDKNAEAFGNIYSRKKTLSELIDYYMEHYEGRDRSILDRLAWWKENYGYHKLNSINKARINEGLKKLSKGQAERFRGKEQAPVKLDKIRSPATVNRYQQALSSVLSWGVREGWLTDNPVKQIQRRKESRGRVRFLSDDERKALLEACDKSEWKGLGLVARLALSTGARQGEIMGLKWSDIDLKRNTATLHETKNDEIRVLPLVESVSNQLKAWGKVRRLDNELVFPSPNKDKPFHIRPYWGKAVEEAELVDFRFHDLRHSCASYLAMAGASHLEIAEVLGHKTLQMVKRYSHLNHEHKAGLLERTTGKLLG